MSTGAETALDTLVQRFRLKALVEACLVLEEGVAGLKDIDLGIMAGAGIVPGPFARADQQGLDDVLDALGRASAAWGEEFAPPLILRRLVAQGRLGLKSGQGFFAYARPDEGGERETIKVETRGDVAILWLDRPPANALAPAVFRDLRAAWSELDGRARAVVIASANPFVFSAGADIREFTTLGPEEGAELIDAAHGLMRDLERSRTATIAAVGALAYGGGCELAMACDVRVAAQSAIFAQPEINLGIIPGFGGTQRLPRLVGHGRALGLNLTGEPIGAPDALAIGLVNEVVPDHELFDTALAWARKLAAQPPVAIEQIKRAAGKGDLDDGLAAEKEGFAAVFATDDAREGISAFLGKRTARFRGT
ncbi:MAG: enoyl-CoA hydratase-related protein [Actinomycetota bacterium]|nr:enoyl-CoA hydratase-related protein [Actinomycetota bacterium]